jgi:hypothetical protein
MKTISVSLVEEFYHTVKWAYEIIMGLQSPSTDAQWAVAAQLCVVQRRVIANNRKVFGSGATSNLDEIITGGFDAQFAVSELGKAERSIRGLGDEAANTAAELLRDLSARLLA